MGEGQSVTEYYRDSKDHSMTRHGDTRESLRVPISIERRERMDRLIRVKVDGHHLKKDNRTAGVQHEANAAKMRIEFDPSWDEYAKKITFWNADGKNPVERMLTADLLENIAESTRVYRCFIPGEAMTEAGELTFIIDGYVDGKRQRSVFDTLDVEAAPYIAQADQPADPTPTQAEQLQVQIERLLNDVRAETIMAEQAKLAAELAKLGAEQARAYAEAIMVGQIVPEVTLKDKADLVGGKVPKEQLPDMVGWDNGVPEIADVLVWAREQSAPTTTAATPQTLNMPYPDYWTVDLKISALGAWRRLIARLSSTSKMDIRERYFINGAWGQWEQIAIMDNTVRKTGDTMTGILQVSMGGGNTTVVADPACAYIQAFRDNSWDNRRTLLLRTKESAPDMTNALAISSAGADAAEYTVLHTGNLQLLSGLVGGSGKVKVGSYTGSGTYGGSSPNSIQLDFEPDMVIVQDAGMNGAMVWGIWIRGCLMFMSYTNTYSSFVQDSSRNFKWASTASAAGQFNSSGVAYGYIAIKFG